MADLGLRATSDITQNLLTIPKLLQIFESQKTSKIPMLSKAVNFTLIVYFEKIS
jgi:hypothetical protein